MSMSSVQWLNLNRVKLHEIPEEIGKLGKLVCIKNYCFKFILIFYLFVFNYFICLKSSYQ
jgi:hypothetical protein